MQASYSRSKVESLSQLLRLLCCVQLTFPRLMQWRLVYLYGHGLCLLLIDHFEVRKLLASVWVIITDVLPLL